MLARRVTATRVAVLSVGTVATPVLITRTVTELGAFPATLDDTASFATLLVALARLVLTACLTWLGAAATVTAAADVSQLGRRLFGRLAGVITPQLIRTTLRLAGGAVVAAPGLSTGVTTAAAYGPVSPAPGHPACTPPTKPSSELLLPDRPPHGSPTTGRPAEPVGRDGVRQPVVVVRRGDSLWSIAAMDLPTRATDADISAAWPQWYAANRSRIGSDPDLLLPGTALAVPPDIHAR